MHGAKDAKDALVDGVLNSAGNAYDNVKDAIAQGIIGKEQSPTISIKVPKTIFLICRQTCRCGRLPARRHRHPCACSRPTTTYTHDKVQTGVHVPPKI